MAPENKNGFRSRSSWWKLWLKAILDALKSKNRQTLAIIELLKMMPYETYWAREYGEYWQAVFEVYDIKIKVS